MAQIIDMTDVGIIWACTRTHQNENACAYFRLLILLLLCRCTGTPLDRHQSLRSGRQQSVVLATSVRLYVTAAAHEVDDDHNGVQEETDTRLFHPICSIMADKQIGKRF